MVYISWHPLIVLMELPHLIHFERTCKSSVKGLIIILVLYYCLLFRSVQGLHVSEDFGDINSLFHLISQIIKLHDVHECLPSDRVSPHK